MSDDILGRALGWENARVVEFVQAFLGMATPNLTAVSMDPHPDDGYIDLHFALLDVTGADVEMVTDVADYLHIYSDFNVTVRPQIWVGGDWAADWPARIHRMLFSTDAHLAPRRPPDRAKIASMTTDLTIELNDTSGELGRLGLAFGVAGVNIEGLCAVTQGGPTAAIHVLVDDAEAAYNALDSAGIEIQSDAEVLVVEVDDHPGVLGEIAQQLGDAGINIELIYLATATRLVIGADDLHRARQVLDG